MFRWETPKERTLRLKKISPKTKMEWLREINEFMAKASSKKIMKMRQKLRELGAR
jgi:hypothetical protein